MKRCIKADVMYLLLDLLTGDSVKAIEAAKKLVSLPADDLAPDFLSRVVDNSEYKIWSRIAAAYVLGFIPLSKSSGHQHVLRKTLSDKRSSTRLRTHAAEALGNLRDEGSATLLKEILLDSGESTSLRKWCIYALSEVDSSEAREALKSFSMTSPEGVLGEELQTAAF